MDSHQLVGPSPRHSRSAAAAQQNKEMGLEPHIIPEGGAVGRPEGAAVAGRWHGQRRLRLRLVVEVGGDGASDGRHGGAIGVGQAE